MDETTNESAAHTPGPWMHVEEDGRRMAIGTVGTEYFPLSRRVAVTIGIGNSDKANARLIAAAPELLAALEGMVGLLDGYPCKPNTEVHAGLANARAAIAKARGLDQ